VEGACTKMLIPTQTTIALRCFSCGKMNFSALSRFGLGEGKSIKIVCECGTCLVLITKNKGSITLQVECVMCEAKHLLKYRPFQLWNGKLLKIICENTDIEIGCIGSAESVRQSVKSSDRSISEMADEIGYDRYFLNPEIMYQVLDLLRKITEEGRLSCGCGGSRLEAEVYPDRVEINCSLCGAVGIIFAETVKDLQWVTNMEEIQLEANTYRYLDDKRLRKRGSSRKRNT